MKNILEALKELKTWFGILIAIFAVYGSAASIGLDIPRWTWFSEHKVQVVKLNNLKKYSRKEHIKLASASSNNRARILSILLKSSRSRYYQNRAYQKSQMKGAGNVDPELIKEEAELRGQIDELESELKKIRRKR